MISLEMLRKVKREHFGRGGICGILADQLAHREDDMWYYYHRELQKDILSLKEEIDMPYSENGGFFWPTEDRESRMIFISKAIQILENDNN